MKPKQDLVQLQNPKSHRYVVVDRNAGSIVKHSPTSKPYKHIPIIDKNTPEYQTGLEPIHGWFELSYAHYLVLPRSILQSAPIEWQQRFIEALNELEEMFGTVPENGTYEVHLRDNDTHRYMSDPLSDYERGRRRIAHK